MSKNIMINKEKIIRLIARYGHLGRILTVAGVTMAVVIAALVLTVFLVNHSHEDKLPTNAVFDEDGNLTEVLGGVSVCIDPGHGYDDPGADSDFLGDDCAEREINFDVALKVRDILSGYNVNVIMTHDKNEPDENVPMNEDGKRVIDPVWRAEFANANSEISLFVSLHCDSFPQNESVSGTRIYYMPKAKNGGAAGELAKECAGGIKDVFGENVMLKPMTSDEAYYVIKHINVPSVLIEMGFITNSGDAADMLSEAWRQKMAEGIANGIIEYILN